MRGETRAGPEGHPEDVSVYFRSSAKVTHGSLYEMRPVEGASAKGCHRWPRCPSAPSLLPLRRPPPGVSSVYPSTAPGSACRPPTKAWRPPGSARPAHGGLLGRVQTHTPKWVRALWLLGARLTCPFLPPGGRQRQGGDLEQLQPGHKFYRFLRKWRPQRGTHRGGGTSFIAGT